MGLKPRTIVDRSCSILVVTPTYPTRTSYAGVFVADQVAALRGNHEVAVVVPEPRGWRAVLRLGSSQGGAAGDTETIVHPVARTWIPRWERSIAAGYIRALDGALTMLPDAPDLIHAHVTYPIGHAAVVVGRRHGIPVVITEHSGPFAALVPNAFARRSARTALLDAAAVLAVGPTLRDELAAFAPGLAPSLVGNVVDTEFFTPSREPRRPGPPRLLSVGIQMPQKGVDLLLAAAQLLVGRGRRIELQIVGDGPERPGLEAAARDLGISDVARFTGVVERDVLRRLMQDADVVLSASRTETFGLAIAEALACGRPVVATRTGGADWVVPEGAGILVEPGSPTLLADAVEAILSGESGVDPSFGRASIVRRFSRRVIVAALEDIYSEVLARPMGAGRG